MRIRRFRGSTAQMALRQIRATLGEEALILGTRMRPDGIEITAAVDVDRVTTAATGEGEGELGALMREMRELSARVRHLDRTLRPAAQPDPRLGCEARELAERLALQGVAAHLVAPVAESFDAARRAGAPAEAALGASLAKHLLPPADEPDARITALVGPTGSGKTTTLAKLAAHERARRRRVGLVMADNCRVGATEQLGAYARLLGVPMRLVRHPSEVHAAIEALADRDRIYVDTAGLGGDAAGIGEVRALIEEAAEPVEVTAVLSATASETALRRLWRQIETLRPASCVITKLDEGSGLAAACSFSVEVGIRPRWLGTGQRVPQDLARATGNTLAHWLMQA